MDRLLLRGLRPHLSNGVTILTVERGTSDALGPTRKVRAVLTDDALLLATPLRARTILTVVPRREIVSVTPTEGGAIAIVFEDYDRAIQRVVHVDLRRRGAESAIAHLLP